MMAAQHPQATVVAASGLAPKQLTALIRSGVIQPSEAGYSDHDVYLARLAWMLKGWGLGDYAIGSVLASVEIRDPSPDDWAVITFAGATRLLRGSDQAMAAVLTEARGGLVLPLGGLRIEIAIALAEAA